MNLVDFNIIIEKFNPGFSTQQLENLVKDVLKSQDSDSKVNYQDLLKELENIKEYNQDTVLWMTYNKFSNDTTGLIEFTKLRNALEDINIVKSDDDLKDLLMILKIPRNEDINFEKFKVLVSHKSKAKF